MAEKFLKLLYYEKIIGWIISGIVMVIFIIGIIYTIINEVSYRKRKRK